MVKNHPTNAGCARDEWVAWFHPWVGKITWSRKWQPTPVFLPGKLQGQRSLMGCSPWACKGSVTTEHITYCTEKVNLGFPLVSPLLRLKQMIFPSSTDSICSTFCFSLSDSILLLSITAYHSPLKFYSGE